MLEKNKRNGIVPFLFSFDIFVGASVVWWHFFSFVSFVTIYLRARISFSFSTSFVCYDSYFALKKFRLNSWKRIDGEEWERENLHEKFETNISDKCDWKRKPIGNKAFCLSFVLSSVCDSSSAEVKLKSFPIETITTTKKKLKENGKFCVKSDQW